MCKRLHFTNLVDSSFLGNWLLPKSSYTLLTSRLSYINGTTDYVSFHRVR